MATSFNTGFKLGTDMFSQAQRNSLAQEELAIAKERDVRAAELHGLNVSALQRTAGREAEQDRITGQIRDFSTGLQRPETNAALDADFEAADQASLQGLKMPAVRGGSNMANQEALAVRKPVDVNSPEYRSGIAGLRQQYALSKGDMADFDRVGESERKRFTDKDDADYVLDLQKNPTGESASQARSFINTQSKRLSSKVDPKTGMTTFALVKGDGYDEVKVSPSDLSKVALGFRRLQRGDVGGLDVIAGVNKELAAVAREELKIDMELGKTNNDANYKTGALNNQRAELGLRGKVADAQIGSYNRANQSPIVALTAEAERLVKAGNFKDVPTAIEALKKGSAKREIDPQQYSTTLKNMNEVYGDPVKARMATDQLFGLTAPTNAVADRLKALDAQKKGGPKSGAAPAAAPAAPLGLQQRLGNAVGTDNSAGNRNQFIALADEAAKTAPAIEQQIEALRRALPMTRSESERDNLSTRIGELETDLGLYRSILDQRNAQRGY